MILRKNFAKNVIRAIMVTMPLAMFAAAVQYAANANVSVSGLVLVWFLGSFVTVTLCAIVYVLVGDLFDHFNTLMRRGG